MWYDKQVVSSGAKEYKTHREESGLVRVQYSPVRDEEECLYKVEGAVKTEHNMGRDTRLDVS